MYRTHSKALVYDIGGTKIECAVITQSGDILDAVKIKTPTASWREGKQALIEVGRSLLEKHPTIQTCGLSSAGPLDAPRGILLHPTNINWGEAEIAKELSAAFGIDVSLENDAACAVLAEHWRGHARGTPDLITLTLGTGLGVGVILQSELLRGGHEGLHPEIGHMVLTAGDENAPCGCGNRGCAEAYLAGSHFMKRARRELAISSLSAVQMMGLAKEGQPRLLGLFESYSLRMAQFLTNLVVSFYPRQVVLAGSFAKASDFFLPRAEFHLRQFLKKRLEASPSLWPQISVSTLQNPGLWGAAQMAFQKKTVQLAADL